LRRTLIARRGFITGVATLLSTPALTQSAWPQRVVRFIFPFTAGSAVDVAIRIVAADLSERIGQQFIVDNRTGAGGSVGTEAAAQSPPDRATFLVGSPGNMAINPAVTRGLRYDALRDFIAVNHIVSFPQVLVVSPVLPVRTLSELVAFSRERPKELNYASSGFGSTNHLAMEMIQRIAVRMMIEKGWSREGKWKKEKGKSEDFAPSPRSFFIFPFSFFL